MFIATTGLKSIMLILRRWKEDRRRRDRGKEYAESIVIVVGPI